MTRIKLHPDFANVVASHGIGMNEIADAAEIGRTTLYALQKPEKRRNRVGGMYRTTAWKLVNAFSQKTGIPPKEAWGMLLIEEEEEGAPDSD
jgi:hypothetical protein